MNVQRAEIDPDALPAFLGTPEHLGEATGRPDPSVVAETAGWLQASKRPVLLAGGGVRLGGATAELWRVAHRSGAPVAVTLMGLDAIPHDAPNFCGMVGAYGNRYSNLAVANADFLLVAGTRLDTRITGTRPDTFARGARIVHVDIDPNELGRKVRADRCVRADTRAFLGALADALPDRSDRPVAWTAKIREWERKYPSTPPSPDGTLDPNRFIRLLSEASGDDAIVCVDVGQHQMWVAQSFALREGQRALISGGMGAMGFALPAAVGACLASGGKESVVVAGDGGFQINIQELQTIVHHGLPVKMVVMNNRSLGMVRQFQETYFDGRLQSTVIGYSAPDFVKVARAYGIPASRTSTERGARRAVRRMFREKGPYLLEVELGQQTQVNPKLLVNRPIEDMFPFLSREELGESMIVPPLEEE
jgi:acetolactate synthase-1/2/3 large subunit